MGKTEKKRIKIKSVKNELKKVGKRKSVKTEQKRKLLT
jgi:hypothetical protein